jgi:hypothetical protein
MNKNMYVLFALVMVCAMVLSACGTPEKPVSFNYAVELGGQPSHTWLNEKYTYLPGGPAFEGEMLKFYEIAQPTWFAAMGMVEQGYWSLAFSGSAEFVEVQRTAVSGYYQVSWTEKGNRWVEMVSYATPIHIAYLEAIVQEDVFVFVGDLSDSPEAPFRFYKAEKDLPGAQGVTFTFTQVRHGTPFSLTANISDSKWSEMLSLTGVSGGRYVGTLPMGCGVAFVNYSKESNMHCWSLETGLMPKK